MGKKRSFQQTLIEFAVNASPEQLDTAIDTLQAVKRSKSAATRAPRKPAKPTNIADRIKQSDEQSKSASNS